MISIELEVSEKDAVSFFRSKGIEVIEDPINGLFGPVGKTIKVVNPTNGLKIPLERAFGAVVTAQSKRVLIDDIDKLTIYQTLNNLK